MDTVVTIGRQFGSGGHDIGMRLAKKYNINCYDKDLISRAAKESGLCEEMIEMEDERPTNSFLYNLVMDTHSIGLGSAGIMNMPISHKVFLAQFDAIKKIAAEGPCVIMGRCADYALQDFTNVVHLFIAASEEFRIENIRKRFPDITSDQQARELMNKKDRQRRNYYNYYSSKKWGRAESYDLIINSAILGTEGSAELISQFIDDFEKYRKSC